MSKELEDGLPVHARRFYTCENDSFVRALLRYVCHRAASGFYMSSSSGGVF